MEKEFVPYNEALALKELGFNEPCFGYYLDEKLNIFHSTSENDRINSKTIEIFSSDVITSPTFSQAFRWFREKYNLHPIVTFDKFIDEDDNDVELDEPYFTYYYSINELWDNTKDYNKFVRGFVNVSSSRGIMSQEEAELACLIKLIEIVKTK